MQIGSAISAISLGLQGIGLLNNFFAERETEDAYNAYQLLQSQSALRNFIQQTKAINTRYAQEQEASGLEREQIYLKNLQAKAAAQASAASMGVEGNSIDMLFRGYDRSTAISNYVAARNLQWQGIQYNHNLEEYRVNALNSIYSMPKYENNRASTLLSGIGGILSSYANYSERIDRLKKHNGSKN